MGKDFIQMMYHGIGFVERTIETQKNKSALYKMLKVHKLQWSSPKCLHNCDRRRFNNEDLEKQRLPAYAVLQNLHIS